MPEVSMIEEVVDPEFPNIIHLVPETELSDDEAFEVLEDYESYSVDPTEGEFQWIF